MISPLWILLAVASTPAAPDREVVTRTACTSLEGKTVEAAKQELLLAARRAAVEELLGSVVTSVTRVENLKLQKDRIEDASAGYLQLAGEPEFFNGQSLGELCVTIQAYTLEKDRSAIELALRALVDGQAPPKFVLDTDLGLLGLGARTVVAVTAIPPQALDGARCEWTIEPADVLRTAKSDGACRLEVAMPVAPLPGRASTLPARIAVRIRREDQVLDELAVRGAIRNGIAIEPVVDALALAQGAAVQVEVVPRGQQDPVPPGYTCSWNIKAAPLVFTPSTGNSCRGRLELKPEDTWSQMEGVYYATALLEKAPLTIAVRLLYGGGLVSEGSTEVKLIVADSRDPQKLLRHFIQRRLRSEFGGLDDVLTEAGLPPSSSLNEKNLEIHLAFERDQWSVTTYYNSGKPEAALLPLDRQTALVRILYSFDGKSFLRWDLAGMVPASRLAEATEIWVKIEPGIGGEAAGPFRLPFDFGKLARPALEAAWQALDEEEKQQIACHSFVVGRKSYTADTYRHFLAIIDEIAVAHSETGLWQARRYDARLEHMLDKAFELVPRPVGPADYFSRVRFSGGKEETFACPMGPRTSPILESGRYYRLKRTSQVASRPEEIEVYLKYQSPLGWTVHFGDDLLNPPFVRVSSGGAGFRTIERNGTDDRKITFPEAEGKELILRFVMAGGEEVEYRGKIDYSAHRFATLRDQLFRGSRLACAASDFEPTGDEEVDRGPQGMDGPAVVCGFEIGHGEYMPIDSALPVLHSVDYGCARDQLTFKDRFDDERARGLHSRWVELTFTLPRHCETVFAHFTLADGSRSEILAAPVVSPR